MLFFIYAADNKIGVIGIKILTKVSMPNLEKLYLGTFLTIIENCQIGNEGVKHLNKGKWSNIEHLLLSKLIDMKEVISYKAMDMKM